MDVSVVSTPTLEVAVEVSGDPQGQPIMLLHGWPDDVRTWDGIVPGLNDAGFRTFVPYLRGFGKTRFASEQVPRTGQLGALGQDVLDLAERLELGRFAVVGHDWGARAAYIASCVAGSERISHCTAISVGWGTNRPDQELSLQQVQNYWYHWYFALERGAELVREHRDELTAYIWEQWNPGWQPDPADFAATALSFENPDWAEVVLHSYRSRWGLAPGDRAYAGIEAQVSADPQIDVPTLVIHGGADPCNAPTTSFGKEEFFTAGYRRVELEGVGHFPQRQQPQEVLQEILRELR